MVVGGLGVRELARNERTCEHPRQVAARSGRVTSVCTGALALAAAGLLDGYEATTHWASLEELAGHPEVRVLGDRLHVQDRDRWTSAGVTAGIDAALHVAADLRGEAVVKSIQLYMEYAPEPPFDSGTPETAPAEILNRARRAVADLAERRMDTARRVAQRLGVRVPD